MKCFGIIPACGRSQRMGQPKLLLPFGRATLIEHVLSAWCASRIDRVTVVARADDRELQEVVRRADVDLAIPDRPPRDMKASVRVGLAHIAQTCKPNSTDAWLLAPADMPGLVPALINHVIQEHSAANASILVPVCGEQKGHPVLFPWPLAVEVERLGADEGVNVLLGRHPVRNLQWNDPAAFRDIDTPEDYEDSTARR